MSYDTRVKKNQFGFAAIEAILILLLAAAIGVIVYMAYQARIHNSSHGTASVSSPKSATTQETTPASTTTTYNGASISFTYPKSWQLMPVDNTNIGDGTLQNIFNAADPYVAGSTIDQPVFEVSEKSDKYSGSIDSLLNSLYPDSSVTVTSKTQIQIAGRTAYRVTNSLSQSAIYIFNGGTLYEFDNFEPNSSSDAQAFTSLLDSVKFK